MRPFGLVTNTAFYQNSIEFYQVAYRTCCPNQSHPILVPIEGSKAWGLWLELLWCLWMLAPGRVNGIGPGCRVLPGCPHRLLP